MGSPNGKGKTQLGQHDRRIDSTSMTPRRNHVDLPPPRWLLGQEVEEPSPSSQKDQWRADEGRLTDDLICKFQFTAPPLLLYRHLGGYRSRIQIVYPLPDRSCAKMLLGIEYTCSCRTTQQVVHSQALAAYFFGRVHGRRAGVSPSCVPRVDIWIDVCLLLLFFSFELNKN